MCGKLDVRQASLRVHDSMEYDTFMTERTIDVLVVDDSQVMRLFLVHLLESDPQIRVAGAVGDGQAALDFVMRSKPDVVLMDIHLPGMDGFEATRRIMEAQAVPIVICSATTNPSEMATTFKMMEAGAVACIEKPPGPAHGEFEAMSAHLLETVKLMSEVKVVRRFARARPVPAPMERVGTWLRAPAEIKVVGFGTSTGGPPVLQTILSGLPKDFPVPILVVQHIARGFLPGLVEWLTHATGVPVLIASHGMVPRPGHVYLAPDDLHMGVGNTGSIVLTWDAPDQGLRPAVSHLFHSLANVYGPNALGVLLTGMGKDGAAGLKRMKDAGAITIAQDRESSVVHGMPGEAIAMGAATHVVSAHKIAEALVALVNHRQIESRG